MTSAGPNVLTRRAYRERQRHTTHAEQAVLVQHGRRRFPRIVRLSFALAGATLVIGGTVALTAALAVPAAVPEVEAPAAGPEMTRGQIEVEIQPLPADGLPAPTLGGVQATGQALCEDPAFLSALDSGTDAAVVAAAGGAEPFRAAVAAGAAPCVPLDDPERVWVVVNKVRPYAPLEFAPSDLVAPEGVRSLAESWLRADAAAALAAMVQAAATDGVGEIALGSAYRSYATQRVTYAGHVADRGQAGADLVSARPGFSEHQSGLGVDVVPCAGSCATIDDLAASPQGGWVEANAWQHGWIVRYTEGATDVTGYVPEPWHLRYIGPELARAYHEGGWRTLEEFFGLPPAPGYTG